MEERNLRKTRTGKVISLSLIHISYKRFLREFKFENASEYSVKDEIKADIFAAGDKVCLLYTSANVSTFLQDIENAINDDTKIIIVDASGIGSIDITCLLYTSRCV